MKKLILLTVTILAVLSFIAATYFTTQNQNLLNQSTSYATSSPEAITSLESRGFDVAGQYLPVRSPRMIDSTNLPETAHLKMSLDVRKAKNLQITWLGAPATQKIAASQNDTILVEDFEGDFPGASWQLSGDPTWGKSDCEKHGGQNSVFCAKGGTAGVTPPANYPNNMNAMMVFGPFDLSNASLAFVRFWFWLETEINKDWFWYMASMDGVNFSGISVSGSTGWEQTSLNLADVYQLGSLIGKSSVWIAFGFTSDSTGAKRGVFVDDVEVQKAAVGTGISGYLKGILSPAGNPYIAFDHVGVTENDSLLIEPGVQIYFENSFSLIVYGALQSIGLVADSIIFTSRSDKWGGIEFIETQENNNIKYSVIQNGSSNIYCNLSTVNIENCSIRNGDIGIESYGSRLTISSNKISFNHNQGIRTGMNLALDNSKIINNQISNNGTGISSSYSIITIVKNKIIDNSGYGVRALDVSLVLDENTISGNKKSGVELDGNEVIAYGDGIIRENRIYENYENGILISTYDFPFDVCNNIISKNQCNGILIEMDIWGGWSEDTEFNIYNNTLYQNSKSGIEVYASSSFGINPGTNTIMNNIIALNQNFGIFIQKYSEKNYILFNDFFNNGINIRNEAADTLGKLVLINTNGDSCDAGYNIFLDPTFVNPDAMDFSLQANSSCKNAGNPSEFYVDLDGSVNDMGAYGGTMLFIYPNPPSLNFGDVFVGLEKKLDFIITNDRNTDFIIKNIQLSDSLNFFTDLDTTFVLKAYQNGDPDYKKRIKTTFKPQTMKLFSEIVEINSDDLIGMNSGKIYLKGNVPEGTQVSGEVFGIWTKEGSPYVIVNDSKVPDRKSLFIESGVEVIKGTGYQFKIEGLLIADGALKDTIIFRSAENSTYGPLPLLFFIDSDSLCRLNYCKLREGYGVSSGAIYCENSLLKIANCSIMECSLAGSYEDGAAAIFCKNSNIKITNSIIKNNQGDYCAGIQCKQSTVEINNTIVANNYSCNGVGAIDLRKCKSLLKNNRIFNNIGIAGAVRIWENGPSLFLNNTIYLNSGRGIAIGSLKFVLLENNVIFKNSDDGIELYSIDSSIVKNCIIRENKYEKLYVKNSSVFVTYSNISGGYDGLGNMDNDPCFTDINIGDFHLNSNSPCIDVGDPDSIYNDPEDPANPGYALYPALGTIRNDMGAYGGPGASGFAINHPPTIFSLLTPANGDTIQTITPTLKWHKAIDPDPEDIAHYTVLYDTSRYFINSVMIADISDTSFTLTDSLNNNTRYFWTVMAIDKDSFTTASSDTFSFLVRYRPTGVAASEVSELPTEFALSQNYPNPFNSLTTIKYQLPTAQEVKLAIYNLRGQRVATLVDRNEMAGYYSLIWDGKDGYGNQVASGVYLYRLETEGFVKVRKLVLLR